MAGGHATHLGIGFQDEVAAILAVYLLAEESVPFFGLEAGVAPVAVELESNAPIDDILVKTSSDGFCFINVKKSVQISSDPKSPLGSVIDQFVRQWIVCAASQGNRAWERPLESAKDRFVLVTGGARANSFVAATSNMLARIANKHSVLPRGDIATTEKEGQAYDALSTLIRHFWDRHTGESPTDEDLASLLGITRVALIDTNSVDRSLALSLLKSVVLENPNDAEKAWTLLVSKCHKLGELRSVADRTAFREVIRAAGCLLRGAPGIQADLRCLKQFTDESLDHLGHLAHLKVPTTSGSRELGVKRKITTSVIEHAQAASMLLISPPGAGKSGVLYWAGKQLRDQGHPVVVVAVERHPVSTLRELEREMGLEGSLLDVLNGWTTSKPGVFIIDSLDASRGGPSDRVFQDLIRRILSDAPSWKVVASVRVFDLRFGVALRELFAGKPLNKDYCDTDFPSVQHLLVPCLSEDEFEQIWSASPAMHEAYERSPSALKDLLANIFNIFLLANILTAGGPTESFAETSTQIDLLDRYWSHRVMDNDQHGVERERLLRAAADNMIRGRSLLAERRTVESYGGQNLVHLLSEGVLLAAQSRGDRFHFVSFSHHMLFDYAVARLVLEGGYGPDLVTRLVESDDLALWMAPGAIIAFQMLWQEGSEDRQVFWEKAFDLAEAPGGGAFCRMLPARVAAEFTERLHDFAPVIECLSKKDCSHHTAALFLLKHCIGVLATGLVSDERIVGPKAAEWSSIVRQLTQDSIAQVGQIIRPIIAQLADKISQLTFVQKQDLGKAARDLVLFFSNTLQYDEGAVILGIKAIAWTFETAPSESSTALRALLSPEHVRQYGHSELFWLAQQVDQMIMNESYGKDLVADLYRAAYCTPLPSGEEQTSISKSRILSLVSNKRQDFEMSRYLLGERFERFFDASPVSATGALVDIMECQAQEEKFQQEEVTKFPFGELEARYRVDWSCIWATSESEKDASRLLRDFTKGLGKLAESGRDEHIQQIITTVAIRNTLACVWASLVNAGASYPTVIGKQLLPLLLVPQILEGCDTRKPAGELLKALHPLLPSADKRAVEKAILATDREETQRILFGCLKQEDLALDEALERRTLFENEGPLPENAEPFSITTSRGEEDDDWWLKHEGVDLSVEENAQLSQTIRAVEELEASKEADFSSLAAGWKQADSVFKSLVGNPKLPEALRMKGWDALAGVGRKVAEICDEPKQLDLFPEIESMVLGALNESLWPFPEKDEEQEKAFARRASWSSPAPRIEGASALMALGKTKHPSDLDYVTRVKQLSRDPVPAVRFQILSRINMLSKINPELMWQLCEYGFSEEQNIGVLSFFLGAVRKILRYGPKQILAGLTVLDKRIEAGQQGSVNRFADVLANLMLRLWLIYDEEEAGKIVLAWLEDPVGNAARIHPVIHQLSDSILTGDPEHPDPADERIRSRAIKVFHAVTAKTVPLFLDLAAKPSLEGEETKTAETVFRLLDGIALQIYHGSGAYNLSRAPDSPEGGVLSSQKTRQRFLQEMEGTLRILSDAAYPSITHHLLQTLQTFVPDDPVRVFRLVTHTLERGKLGGYQFETAGADLFVDIMRRYLADFRSILVEHADCRQALIRAVDIFVEVGWPNARQLVYELPEMLR